MDYSRIQDFIRLIDDPFCRCGGEEDQIATERGQNARTAFEEKLFTTSAHTLKIRRSCD